MRTQMSKHTVAHFCTQIRHHWSQEGRTVGGIRAGGSASLSTQPKPRVQGCTEEIAGLKHSQTHTHMHTHVYIQIPQCGCPQLSLCLNLNEVKTLRRGGGIFLMGLRTKYQNCILTGLRLQCDFFFSFPQVVLQVKTAQPVFMHITGK